MKMQNPQGPEGPASRRIVLQIPNKSKEKKRKCQLELADLAKPCKRAWARNAVAGLLSCVLRSGLM
jgi:hypothetical protein